MRPRGALLLLCLVAGSRATVVDDKDLRACIAKRSSQKHGICTNATRRVDGEAVLLPVPSDVVGPAAIDPYVAFMTIPRSAVTESPLFYCHPREVVLRESHNITLASWRYELAARVADDVGADAPVAVCTPGGYLAHASSCACVLCLDGMTGTSTVAVGTCVSRAWLAAHPPAVAVGVGSGRQRRVMEAFLCDVQGAPLVVQSPVNKACYAGEFPGLVDVVLDTEAIDKPEAAPRPCEPPDSAAAARKGRCAAAIADAVTGGRVAPRDAADPPCALLFPASMVRMKSKKDKKGQVRFFSAMMASAAARTLLSVFAVHFYGTGSADSENAELLKARFASANLNATFHGSVAMTRMHRAYCAADVVVQFPVADRNPRVPYEAAGALKPVFLSKEAHVAEELLDEPWVGHASYEDADADIHDAFAAFAVAVTATSPAPSIAAFVQRCLDDGAVMGAVAAAVAEGTPATPPPPFHRAMTVVHPDLADCF